MSLFLYNTYWVHILFIKELVHNHHWKEKKIFSSASNPSADLVLRPSFFSGSTSLISQFAQCVEYEHLLRNELQFRFCQTYTRACALSPAGPQPSSERQSDSCTSVHCSMVEFFVMMVYSRFGSVRISIPILVSRILCVFPVKECLGLLPFECKLQLHTC